VLACALAFAAPSLAERGEHNADDSGPGVLQTGGTNSRPSGGGPLGLGLSIGGPTGLTGKYYLTSSTGLSFGVGFGGHGFLGGHLDYVLTPLSLITAEAGMLYPYVGGGVGLGFFGGLGYQFGPIFYRAPLWLDVHLTGGLAWNFHAIPLDVFLEIAPGVALLPGPGLGWHGILGVRYYF
jgi:hypothetical protein